MMKNGDTRLSFLTWNLYLGADIEALLTTPPPPNQIPIRVTEVFRKVLATNFPVRVKAIAREIAFKKPDLIGLQEAVMWQQVIPYFRTITIDFLQLLLDELKKIGLHYDIAAQNSNVSVELPDSQGNIIRLLDRDVILIRNSRKLNIVNKKEANFKTNLNVQIAGQSFKVVRGWSFVDVKTNGKTFRVLNTHLDPTAKIQVEQVNEILVGPANTILPLIIMGDLNSDAVTHDTPTYGIMMNSGFHDLWRMVGNGPGLTCCQNDDLLNPVSSLNTRIDYLLFKNGWKPLEADLVGVNLIGKTNTNFWTSDHAGLIGRLMISENFFKNI
jgi:endonuclease/exonuclease/phosphatase family metal-dependent hydrolase